MKYNKAKAAQYWSDRLLTAETPLNAVGYLTRDRCVNEEYSLWERTILMKIVTELVPSSAMDLGCGIGRLTSSLLTSKSLKKIYLVDISADMIAACQKNLAQADQFNHIQLHYLHNATDQLDIESESVDFVMCMGIFEHLPKSIQKATIEEIHRILAKGSSCVLEINNTNSVFLNSNHITGNEFRLGKQLNNGYYCGMVDMEYIMELFQENRFKVGRIFSNSTFSIAIHGFNLFKKHKIWHEIIKDIHKYDLFPRKDLVDKYADQLILEIKKVG